MKREWLKRKDKAVSPVIGVILMVAITVILAAVIASFVFGIGSKLPKATSQVSLAAKAINDSAIEIDHNGGDSLLWNNTKIIVTNSTGTSWFAQLEYTSGKVIPKAGSTLNVSAINPTNKPYFDPGEQIIIRPNTTAPGVSSSTFGSSGQVVTVKVIDTASGQALLTAQVSLP